MCSSGVKVAKSSEAGPIKDLYCFYLAPALNLHAPPSLHFYTEEHVPLRAEVPHYEDFPPHKRYGQYRRGFARLVQVLKLLFKDTHWVDNLCQCERSPLNPSGNQRFRILRLRG
jgi:hypothetical protein